MIHFENAVLRRYKRFFLLFISFCKKESEKNTKISECRMCGCGHFFFSPLPPEM